MPNFSDGSFRVIGVPEPEGQPHDPGRAKVPGQGPESAFKVPTLRNVALSAPYMHNGRFAKLEEVIDFYPRGAVINLLISHSPLMTKSAAFEITPEETPIWWLSFTRLPTHHCCRKRRPACRRACPLWR